MGRGIEPGLAQAWQRGGEALINLILSPIAPALALGIMGMLKKAESEAGSIMRRILKKCAP